MKALIRVIQAILRPLGYRINKLPARQKGTNRPVGDLECLLQDLAVRGFRPTSILDVGAHKSDWSRTAIKVFPDAKFLLVEPQRELQPYLEQFCHEYPKASYIQAGAGDSLGELELTIWEDFAGSSFLPDGDASEVKGKERRKIKIVTLDSLYEKANERPQLVKLDIQGFEIAALKGAQSLFGSAELFILEVSFYEFSRGWPLFSELVAYMKEKGYEVYDFAGFARRPLDGALGQADVAFARHDGILRASSKW